MIHINIHYIDYLHTMMYKAEMKVNWKDEYEQYLSDDTCKYGDDSKMIFLMITLVLGDNKEANLPTYYANDYNAYKTYVKTGDVSSIETLCLDMLLLLTYITGDMKYASQVVDIGKKSSNPMVTSSAFWSYDCHYKARELYDIPQLPEW